MTTINKPKGGKKPTAPPTEEEVKTTSAAKKSLKAPQEQQRGRPRKPSRDDSLASSNMHQPQQSKRDSSADSERVGRRKGSAAKATAPPKPAAKGKSVDKVPGKKVPGKKPAASKSPADTEMLDDEESKVSEKTPARKGVPAVLGKRNAISTLKLI